MSHENKVSIVVFGDEEDLKNALISVILAKPLPEENSPKHSNERYEVLCAPNQRTACEEIKTLFSEDLQPDMCLLVVEERFLPEDVELDINALHEATGKPKDDIIVVLPLGYNSTDYKFKCCTLEQLFSKLNKVAENRDQMKNNKRTVSEGPEGQQKKTGGRHLQTSSKKARTDDHVTLVLLGMTGSGKSASGNTILGRKDKVFISKASSAPVTEECKAEETEINGRKVCVVDTPDMFDDEIPSSVKKEQLNKCKQLFETRPHVFLLVMHISRFTDGERDILEKLERLFGKKAKKQTVILFTRGDDLHREQISLEKFLKDCQPRLKKMVKECENRCVLFENSCSEQAQVTQLMEIVDKMLKKKK